MTTDNETARKARAEALRKRISDLTNEEKDPGEGSASGSLDSSEQAQPGESPRHFVERRMRELERQKEN